MFTHHCTACDKRQLIFLSQATGVVGTESGPAVSFTCWCGAEQTTIATLGDAEPADNPHALAA